jgi:hypothetical protein
MKLYTEEQVRLLLNEILILSSSVDDAIDSLNSIELPSNEEVEKAAEKYVENKWEYAQNENKESFIECAKWMKEQILNQNKSKKL